MSDFDVALINTLVEEGGYSDNPKDPGGSTYKGITQKTYDAYRLKYKKSLQDVRQITVAELDDIYRVNYWNAVQGDKLPSGLNAEVFDMAVNAGPSEAGIILQRSLNFMGEMLTLDGVIGPATLAAVGRHEVLSLIDKYATERIDFYKKLPTWETFGVGWTNRVERICNKSATLYTIGSVPLTQALAPTATTSPSQTSLTSPKPSIWVRIWSFFFG